MSHEKAQKAQEVKKDLLCLRTDITALEPFVLFRG